MPFNFENSKKVFLAKKDKSSIQQIDQKIRSLCEKINKKENYFTTSSCSGRITLLQDEEKKLPNLFLYRTHNKITFKNFKKILQETAKKSRGTILFKQEPALLVISCKNQDAQWKLFQLARNNGWKKSGILSMDKKNLIELFATENIMLPIIKNKKILADDEFLKIIVKKANQNLEKTWEKIERLEMLIENINN